MGAGVTRPIGFLDGPNNKLLSDPRFNAVQSSRRELKDGLSASSPEGEATGFQAGACLHNVVLVAEVDHVDRELHEVCVDRAGWSNPEYALSGEQEREPVEVLRRAYIEGATIRQVAKRHVMLLIEDLDTSIAAMLPDRRYSVNSQLLNGALMSLTQDPYHLGEIVTERVPMLATGNDLTSLYGPLMRHGRA